MFVAHPHRQDTHQHIDLLKPSSLLATECANPSARSSVIDAPCAGGTSRELPARPSTIPDNGPPLAANRLDLLLGERRTIANSIMGIGKVTAERPRRCRPHRKGRLAYSMTGSGGFRFGQRVRHSSSQRRTAQLGHRLLCLGTGHSLRLYAEPARPLSTVPHRHEDWELRLNMSQSKSTADAGASGTAQRHDLTGRAIATALDSYNRRLGPRRFFWPASA